jgi:acetyl-CoA acyltransferase
MTSPSAVVIGTGMTRFGKFPDSSLRSLTYEAVTAALADSGITADDVDYVFCGNAAAGVLHAQEMIRGQSSVRDTGLLGKAVVNVENACASSSSAFAMAVMAVESGMAEVALALGVEKLTHQDRARSIAAIATAVDLENDPAARRYLSRALLNWDLETAAPAEGGPGHGSKFMDVYAEMTKAYFAATGATLEDLAIVAAKNNSNGARNPKAQFRKAVTAEEVLASREVSPPLRLLMCSSIGDGAAAVVVCSPEFAAKHPVPVVTIEAVALLSGRDSADGGAGASHRAARKAYEQAGLGPEDLDVVELHDAAATGELIGYEDLGLCPPGEGAKLLASGDTQLSGRMPVNPSGGLLARGHPIGATGCAQIVELCDQLRSRSESRQVAGAQIALAQNGGGYLGSDAAAAVVTILSTRGQNR